MTKKVERSGTFRIDQRYKHGFTSRWGYTFTHPLNRVRGVLVSLKWDIVILVERTSQRDEAIRPRVEPEVDDPLGIQIVRDRAEQTPRHALSIFVTADFPQVIGAVDRFHTQCQFQSDEMDENAQAPMSSVNSDCFTITTVMLLKASLR